MNLIEALKKANGKPVRRMVWENIDSAIFADKHGSIQHTHINGDPKYVVNLTENLLADDWYVVEPKSPIEEAIERECDTVRRKQLLTNSFEENKTVIRIAMENIVNLTLDEAKKAVNPGDNELICLSRYDINHRIDALKVKE